MRAPRTLVLLGLAGTLGGCLPTGQAGTLPPTLSVDEVAGRRVAYQNGMPVPSFDWQPRPRIELDEGWRVELVAVDSELTMRDRAASLTELETEAEGRHLPDHDDATWSPVEVPGTTNPPPAGGESGSWYRIGFDVPPDWAGRAVTLRFGSANYVADVWLNGDWVGYHEGGSTPFAFDVGPQLSPGARNVLAVRIDTVRLGTRSDVVPWGLIDWWNYGGLTGPVWLEAAPPVHVSRADVTPFLDAIDVEVGLAQPRQLSGRRHPGESPGSSPPTVAVSATVLPAVVTEENLLDTDPRSLLAPGAEPIVTATQDVVGPLPGGSAGTTLSIAFGDADLWSPASPSLYVLRVDLRWLARPTDPREARQPDTFWTTFGIRHVGVDPLRPRVLLNGEPAFFRGVGLHAESLAFSSDGVLVGGTPAQPPGEVLSELEEASAIGADLIRTGHEPADPTLLMLADRLGFAVWEEIPIYHASPFIFERTMARGIPQQMLREMALRDMNRPSVLFHGLANESTGEEERIDALADLHELDREIDGTRLTGQAAYGWNPADVTHGPLDVAGFTFYHGVFYGEDPGPDTRRALRAAHEANPDRPIMVLEFGRWADLPADEARQLVIFEETYAAIEQFRADEPGGFVSAANWWTLRDFATRISGIVVEDFGLLRPDGTRRPAGDAAAAAFDAPAGRGTALGAESGLERPRSQPAVAAGDWRLIGYLAYGLGLVTLSLIGALVVLTRRGGRAIGRPR